MLSTLDYAPAIKKKKVQMSCTIKTTRALIYYWAIDKLRILNRALRLKRTKVAWWRLALRRVLMRLKARMRILMIGKTRINGGLGACSQVSKLVDELEMTFKINHCSFKIFGTSSVTMLIVVVCFHRIFSEEIFSTQPNS